MQISLKQGEIENAVTQYISSQGINLSGKTVGLEFTAGRGERGLTVDITIEDPKAAAPTGQVKQATEAKAEKVTAAAPVEPAPVAETTVANADAPTAAAPKSSLFGA